MKRTAPLQVSVRALDEPDLDRADRIFRRAFGTFLGLPDPLAFMGDAEFVRSRWRADPASAFGAWADGELAGSNIAVRWGSVGFFGPLTVAPELWGNGIAKRLMEPVLDQFAAWGTRHAGLFTFPHSQKHIGLYQRFGFYPRFLTAVMAKPADAGRSQPQWTRFSEIAADEQDRILAACRQMTDAVYEGLDVTAEIRAVAEQRLGDTLLLWHDGELAGVAVCHSGAGSEGGSGSCYVKFGAVRPGSRAADAFEDLLSACDALAAQQSASRVVAGVNVARDDAYRRMLARGFRPVILGVAMQRPNEPGYNRPGMYVIDDWR